MTVPNRVWPSYTATLALASARPLSTSKLSLVEPPLTTLPVIGLTLSATAVMLGTLGRSVSQLIAAMLAAAPTLPAASVYAAAATVMLALPALTSAVGVKVAVRVAPLALIAPSLPPVTTRLPLWVLSSQVKLLSGSSLKTKLISAVSPALRLLALELMAKLGAVVSTR